jgi:trimethylamine--corrinoid protein Co-methyltransferase
MEVLTHEDVRRIHDASLQVLQGTGVTFHDSPEAVEILRKNGCQADGFLVRFPRQLVEESLALVPDRNALSFGYAPLGMSEGLSLKQGESHIGLIGNAYYVYDYEQGHHRDCVEDDLDDKLLVLDSLEHVTYDCCNLIFHSERLGGRIKPDFSASEATTAFVRRRVRDRAWVLNLTGRRPDTLPLRLVSRTDEERLLEALVVMVLRGPQEGEQLLERCFIPFVWCNPKSPLQYFSGETERIIEVAKSPTPSRWVMISPEVMMGATGPVTLGGALVQQNAEALAGTVLAQLVQPATPVIYGCVSAPMDLRTAEISQGNFETALINAAAVQMADHYGMPSRISPGNTSAREPGVRAAVETALGLYMGIAAGGNLITTGLLDSTLMVSYEHLVLIDELLGQIKSVTHGINTDPSGLALDVINEHGHPSPGFLTSDHTLKHMKQDVYYSGYTGRTQKSYEDWYDKAHTRVKYVLERPPADDHLQPIIKDRLAAVEARLVEDNASWRTGEEGWWHFYVQDL